MHLANGVAYFVVCQISVLFGTLSLLSRPVRGTPDRVGVGVKEGVRAAVSGDAKNKLVAGSARLDVKFHGGLLRDQIGGK